MKILRVGDPHVRPSNLEESERLMGFVLETAMEHSVDCLEILGDLFHTHAIVRLEVVEFWLRWLDTLNRKIKKSVILVGNHDLTGDFYSNMHALEVFSRMGWANVQIVDQVWDSGPFGYMAYAHDRDKFIKRANVLYDRGARVLVCHATFDGSKYENGFPAPDGMPVLPQFIHVISGHIHSQQEFANVIYPGTARWDTISDANQPKGLWLFEHADDGRIVRRDFFTAERVCSPIFAYQWKEGDEAPQIPEGCRASLEAIGSSEFCAKAKALYKGKASFKAKPQDSAKRENRKAGKSLKEFLTDHYPIEPERRARLLKFMEEMKIV